MVAMLFISVSGDIATNIAAMSPTFLSNSSFPRKYVGNTMNAPPIAVDARNMVIVEL
jgi:translation elongation factor EF-Ts